MRIILLQCASTLCVAAVCRPAMAQQTTGATTLVRQMDHYQRSDTAATEPLNNEWLYQHSGGARFYPSLTLAPAESEAGGGSGATTTLPAQEAATNAVKTTEASPSNPAE